MMKIVLCIFTVLVAGCNLKEQKKATPEYLADFEIKIPDNLQTKRELKLSAFADTVTYIALETTSDCLLSKIEDVKKKGDKLFIRSDKDEIFVFTESGRFLNKAGKKGKGPNEYYSLIHYAINDSNVFILDYDRRLAVYKHAGGFERYIKIPRQASRILLLKNAGIAYYIPDSQFKLKDNNYNWLITNYQGDSIGSIMTPKIRDRSDKKAYVSNHFVLTNFSCQHSFTFKEAFNDSLYFIDPVSLQARAYSRINQGVHRMDIEKTFEQAASSNHNMRINNITEIPGYVFISYKCMCQGNDITHHAVYDKRERLFYNLDDRNHEEHIENDIYEGLNFRILAKIDENYLVGSVDAYRVAGNNQMNSSGLTVKETDNPVLVFVKVNNRRK
jgi:hypothetical protein